MEDVLQERDSGVIGNQQWMSQLCEELWDIPLYNLSIPGSHDTMTYCLDKLSPVDPTSPKLLLFFDKYVPRITRSVLLRWSTTQSKQRHLSEPSAADQLLNSITTDYDRPEPDMLMETPCLLVNNLMQALVLPLAVAYVPPKEKNYTDQEMEMLVDETLNVTEQLDAGIRYLDLRIAHRPDVSSDLCFVHCLYTSRTVEETLHEISHWLQQNPQEILLLGCDNLQSMSPEQHICLINCIHRIFGPKLCSKHEQPTLRNLWKQNYQLIVCYDDPVALMFDYLWPSIPYWWANTTKTHSLIHFLEMKKHIGRPDGFFVAGLNLTENASYILKHPFGSMKRMTLPKLPFLYKWVQKQHPGVSRDATNIIAEDLIGSDSFVSAVIKLNMKLLDKTDMLFKG